MATQVNGGNVSEQFLTFQGRGNAALGDSKSCSGTQSFPFIFFPLLEAIVTVLGPLVLWASILQAVVQILQSEDLPLPWG